MPEALAFTKEKVVQQVSHAQLPQATSHVEEVIACIEHEFPKEPPADILSLYTELCDVRDLLRHAKHSRFYMKHIR